jgi:chromosome segregation and condensation protein ScpB
VVVDQTTIDARVVHSPKQVGGAGRVEVLAIVAYKQPIARAGIRRR